MSDLSDSLLGTEKHDNTLSKPYHFLGCHKWNSTLAFLSLRFPFYGLAYLTYSFIQVTAKRLLNGLLWLLRRRLTLVKPWCFLNVRFCKVSNLKSEVFSGSSSSSEKARVCLLFLAVATFPFVLRGFLLCFLVALKMRDGDTL